MPQRPRTAQPAPRTQICTVTTGAPVALLPLAPARDDDGAPGLEHTHHLINVPLLVGHVLAALACPHKVKAGVGEVHLHGVHDLEGHIAEAPAAAEWLGRRAASIEAECA